MYQKVGGLTQDEVVALFKTFHRFASLDDIAEKIRSVPGLRSPTFHAMLRQEYLSMKRSDDPRVKEWIPQFELIYHAYFQALHIEIYRTQIAAVGGLPQVEEQEISQGDPYRLASFVVSREDLSVAALAWLLGSPECTLLKEVLGIASNAEIDSVRLEPARYEEWMRRMMSPSEPFSSVLEPFIAALGPRSFETLSSHPGCVHSIVVFLDLESGVVNLAPVRNLVQVNPGDPFDSRLKLSAGLLDAGLFPDYSGRIPIGVMMSGLPARLDPLLLGCQCFSLDTSMRLLVLPFFSQRDPANDRILEVRFSQLLDACTIAVPPVQRDGPQRAITMGVAYSRVELQQMIANLAREGHDEEAKSRRAGQVLFEEVTRKVLADQLDLDVAVSQIQVAYRDVPDLVVPIYLRGDLAGDPHREMISLTLFEALTQLRKGDFRSKALAASVLANKAILMGEFGRARGALARSNAALSQLEIDEDADVLRAMNHNSDAYLLGQEGKLAQAIASAQKSIRIMQPRIADFEARGLSAIEEAVNFASYVNALGAFEDEFGHPKQALLSYGECRRYLQRIQGRLQAFTGEIDEDWRGHVLSQIRYSLGGVLANEGVLLKRAARIIKSAAERMWDISFGDLVDVASALGQVEEPIDATDTSSVSPEVDSILAVFAVDLFDQIDRSLPLREAAIPILRLAYERTQEALAISAEIEGFNFGCVQARSCADFAEELGEPDEIVMGFLGRAIEFGECSGNLSELVPTYSRMSELKVRAGEMEDAAVFSAKTVSLSRAAAIAASGTGMIERLRGDYRRHVEFAINLEICLKREFECIAMAETAKSAFFSLELARGVPGGGPVAADSDLGQRLSDLYVAREQLAEGLLHAHRGELGVALDTQTQQWFDQIISLDAEIAAAQRELAAIDPRMGSWTRWSDIHDLTAEALRHYLADRSAVAIGAFSCGHELCFYVISADMCRLAPMRVPKDTAAEAALLFQNFIRRDPQPTLQEALQTLRDRFAPFRWLEECVVAFIDERTQYVVVSPEDVLYGFPWAALSPDGRPLVERLPIVSAIGLDSLLTTLPQSQSYFGGGRCLVVSDPLAGSEHGLAGTVEEARHIADALGTSRVVELTGSAATIPAFAGMVKDCLLVHIACHGRFGGIGSNSSELWLAPGGHSATGLLSPAEIVRDLDLTGCALVNVSACEAGRLNSREGIGADGIVSAFLIAGARSVIAAISELDDDGAALFSGRFYREVASGANPLEALAQTQAACCRGELGEWMKAPQHWAGYVAYSAFLPARARLNS